MTMTAVTIHDGAHDLGGYLASINTPAAIEQQKQLAAAYDSACHALIGPNDVQKDGNREFKKKSAWRKLARHFRISVECELADTRVETAPDGFIAYARARAVAPWGQGWADVGACASDEATGRRTITIADAIATAMTRASNRAVSNLIAMGEVSAEEIGNRGGSTARHTDSGPRTSNKPNADKVMPFGRNKGKRLADIETADLESTLKWCRENGKTDIGDAVASVLTERALGSGARRVEDYDVADEDGNEMAERDDLPF